MAIRATTTFDLFQKSIEITSPFPMELDLLRVYPAPTRLDEKERLIKTFSRSLIVEATCFQVIPLLRQQPAYFGEQAARMLDEACRGRR